MLTICFPLVLFAYRCSGRHLVRDMTRNISLHMGRVYNKCQTIQNDAGVANASNTEVMGGKEREKSRVQNDKENRTQRKRVT